MITITANFAASKTTSRSTGKVFAYPAQSRTYIQDDNGRWSDSRFPERAIAEMDVIDDCKCASNWPAIRAVHFAMTGFAL